MTMTPTEKSAILLMTIGEDRAAEVFKHLSTREVQHLSTTMATMSQVSHQQLGEVLNEFQDEAEQYEALSVNASDYLRSVLVKALGEERASSLLEDILESRETASGIETLNFMEPQAAADIIRDEHPQIIATILVHLKRAQAADILAQFDERQRNDVVLRIATFGGVQPTALQELTEVLNGLLDGQNLKRSKMGGIRTAAEIINLMKTQQEESVIEAMRIYDGELAQKLSTKCSCSKPGRRRRSQHSAHLAGSGVRISAHRPQRCRRSAAREIYAQYVAACSRYSARRSLHAWASSSIAGRKRTESDSVDRSPIGGKRRSGDRRRRGCLCLILLTRKMDSAKRYSPKPPLKKPISNGSAGRCVIFSAA